MLSHQTQGVQNGHITTAISKNNLNHFKNQLSSLVLPKNAVSYIKTLVFLLLACIWILPEAVVFLWVSLKRKFVRLKYLSWYMHISFPCFTFTQTLKFLKLVFWSLLFSKKNWYQRFRACYSKWIRNLWTDVVKRHVHAGSCICKCMS